MTFDRVFVQMLHDDILYGICRSKDMYRFLGVFRIYRKRTKREQLRDIKLYMKDMETFDGIIE